MRHHRIVLLLLIAGAGCATTGGPAPTAPPDAGRRVVAERGAVASANPLASEAGLAMLQAGGNAMDAAVATAFAIGVVEPQMSGVGGGGAMTIWLAAERRPEFLDFYSAQNVESYRAAFAAGRIPAGRPGPGDLRVTAVPGNVAGLLAAHERYGRLPREQVMAPAIRLAEEGYPINQVLADFIRSDSAKLNRFDSSARMMWPGGSPLEPGDRLRNPELAATLRRIAERGTAGFYEGETARILVEALNAAGNPTTLEDLRRFPIQWERPLCADYRGLVLLSAPPPQSGSQVLHTLEMLESYDLPSLGLPTHSARAFAVLASALRAGIADNRANDDPNWVPVPAAGIVSEAFARERAAAVGDGDVPRVVEQADATLYDGAAPPPSCVVYEPYGRTPPVPGAQESRPAPGQPADGGETTHVSVVDAEGNAVSLTQTNSSVFGAGASVAGFFLNDSGYIFTEQTVNSPSLSPWRTRTTTISPTIALRDGRVEMVIGAPGGGLIPTSMIQVMVYTLDYGMDPLEAVRMPRLFPTPGSPTVQLETGFGADVLEQVKRSGWMPTALAPTYARLYLIVRRDGRWIAVADPRHNGEARGY